MFISLVTKLVIHEWFGFVLIEMAGPSDGNTDALLAENKMDLDSPGLKASSVKT